MQDALAESSRVSTSGAPHVPFGARLRRGVRAQYLLAIPVAGWSTLVSALISPWAQLADLVMVYLLGVLAIAARATLGPALFAAIVSILAFDYFFIPPAFAVSWPDAKSAFTFVGMLVVAAVVSKLNQGLVKEREAARRSEARTAALHAFSQELSELHGADQLTACALRHLERLFDARVLVALAGPDGELATSKLGLSAREASLARRAWATSELVVEPGEKGFGVWCPLSGSHGSVGIVGLAPRNPRKRAEADMDRLLPLMANQVGGAVERMLLSAAAHRAQLVAEAEQTRSSLLAAVSHDLKTPLAAILAAATVLSRDDCGLEPETRAEFLRTVVDEAERLNRLVSNLLSMTKLEAGAVALRRQPEDIGELVDGALRALALRLTDRKLGVELEANLPLVDVDAMLVQQVLINALENALRYTPSRSGIQIRAARAGDSVLVQVVDEGPGIPLEEREKVFEKFFRGREAARGDGGVGLGLTICRAAIVAHGGKIHIGQGPRGGASVEFTLPVTSKQVPVEAAN